MGAGRERAVEAYERLGSYEKAGKELGLSKGTVFNHVKCARAAANDNEPVSKSVSRTTTLRRGSPGSDVVLEWERVDYKAADRERHWREFAEALSEKVERVEPVVLSELDRPDNLMTVYLVGDHHLGMLAWRDETGGDNYDLKIGTKLLQDVMNYLTGAVPPTREALVIVLGDFLHTDGYVPETPLHRHKLDSDSRYPRIAAAAAKLLRGVADAALDVHEEVTLLLVDGNHDPVSTVWLRISMAAAYENEPRLSVIQDVSRRQYVKWGRNLIGVTHGHGIKITELGSIMAAERPEDWGATAHRYWYTGHIHHDQIKQLRGVKVESVNVLPPPDAYTAGAGYASPRDMKAIILDRRFGERGRFTAPAEMFAEEEEEKEAA